MNDERNLNSLVDPVVAEAEERFTLVASWEADARTRWIDDYKFENGDVYNGYQWPNQLRVTRDIEEKPSLTINKTRQHCLQIINDAKRNKPGIQVRATGGGATYQSAQLLGALIRHIEYISKASVAYDTAMEFQVIGGKGYIRVSTDYADNESFNQQILIERVKDPLSVYMDRDAKEADKSDARYCIIVDVLAKDDAKRKYPKFAEKMSSAPLKSGSPFLRENQVCVAEYFRKVEEKDVLYAIVQPNGQPAYMRKSMLKAMFEAQGQDGKEYFASLDADTSVRKRDVCDEKIEWYLIIGQEIAEKKIWPGKYIPLVPVVGEEVVIEGNYDCRGHVRGMIDPQRMYNYWSSAAVEYGALQGKTPWIAPVEAIEGYETYYTTTNRINHAWLPYKARDKNGQELPPPQRTQPPVAAPVAVEGMKIALAEFGLASGQYENSMGQQSNERSAQAMFEHEKRGDNATFHFLDNQAIAIRQVGMIVLDLIPKIYDTKQVMQIINLEEQPIELIVDPQAQEAYEARKDAQGKIVSYVLNPSVGKYEVQADVGPGFATRREEAFEAFKLILTQNPTLTGVLGDILFRAGDFPHADEAAQRLRRMVPAYALGEGPSPGEQMLQKQVQQLMQLLAQNMEELSTLKLRHKGQEQKRDIGVYDAFTKRLNVLLKSKIDAVKAGVDLAQATQGQPGAEGSPGTPGIEQGEIEQIIQDLMPDLLGVDLTPIIAANAQVHEEGVEPPMIPLLNDPSNIRRDFAGRPFGRDFGQSKAFRPV